MTAFFEKSGTLLVVAAKCGITTFNHTLQKYAVTEYSEIELEKYDRIILSMRAPLSRLLSAWRMCFVAMSEQPSETRLRLMSQSLQGTYLKRYLRMIQPLPCYLQNPQGEFDRFCKSKLANWLVKHDPHFWPQHEDYEEYFDLPNTLYVNSIPDILHYFVCEPVRLNRSPWPWKSQTLEDFCTPAVQSFLHRYYQQDLYYYNLCEKLTSCQGD